MKTALLILLLCGTCLAQETEWKFIKEMSGTLKEYPGFPMETRATEIARGDDYVKVTVRLDYPNGAPRLFQKNLPSGVHPSEVSRVEGRLELNCDKLRVKAVGNSSSVYLFSGRSFKLKESAFKITDANIFGKYFCERPAPRASKPPTLKS